MKSSAALTIASTAANSRAVAMAMPRSVPVLQWTLVADSAATWLDLPSAHPLTVAICETRAACLPMTALAEQRMTAWYDELDLAMVDACGPLPGPGLPSARYRILVAMLALHTAAEGLSETCGPRAAWAPSSQRASVRKLTRAISDAWNELESELVSISDLL